MHDLLNEDIIGVQTPDGLRRVSLPSLLGLLSAGRVDGYTGLRPHQADPWHVFLVQVAASILARRPADPPPSDPEFWLHGLLDLAGGEATAWELVVEDVKRPAFLQHPWAGGGTDASAFGLKPDRSPKASTADELDVLVTAKNHDVKAFRLTQSDAETWLYAALLYQTTSGFLGAGNYGIVRMNGGFGSRPVISWVSDIHPSRRFVEELGVLCAIREEVAGAYGYAKRGVVLTWLSPWRRSEHQYFLPDLEPWFVEAARPLRLYRTKGGELFALGATSQARQIGPKTLESGDVGDPWIPINTADKKKGRSAMTLTASGFTPERVTALIFEQDFELTPLQRARTGTGGGWFTASVLARGQGTTEGFHRVALPVPPKARLAFGNKERRSSLAAFAQVLLGDAKHLRTALNHALTLYAEGGPDTADFDRKAVKAWVNQALNRFGTCWESLYFPTLWRAADEDREQVRASWQVELTHEAIRYLEASMARLPLSSNRRWRAEIRAGNAFRNSLSKHGIALPGTTLISKEATP